MTEPKHECTGLLTCSQQVVNAHARPRLLYVSSRRLCSFLFSGHFCRSAASTACTGWQEAASLHWVTPKLQGCFWPCIHTLPFTTCAHSQAVTWLISAAGHTLDEGDLSADEGVTSDLPTAISSLSYSAAAATLAAGTSTGQVALWKCLKGQASSVESSARMDLLLDSDPSQDWVLQRSISVSGRVNRVLWSHDDRSINVQTMLLLHVCFCN